MRCTIPEISWHNREPVLSVALHPVTEKFYRLATGGADCHVLIWQLNIVENGSVKLETLSDLTRHQKAINCVKWSSFGQYLVSGDDDANIIIWKLKTDNIPLLEGETNDREVWIVHKVMRGHKEDVYDICWSINDTKLLSGSIDNTAILWDVEKGKNEHILSDHKGFVQGVSWDPKGQYIATISTDRICRIFSSNGKQVLSRIQKGKLPVPESHYLHNKDVKYFHDDTFKSFFRRLHFSPDGTLLAVPSGSIEVEDSKKILNASYIFAVDSWTQPVAVFPSGKQSSTVVRFCPIFFELHEDGPESIISLPYRMILAVGTDHDVILYDTQQLAPFAYFRDIHYTRLTDLTWSNDGLLLIASSTDGFCALITFEKEELGVMYVKQESEAEAAEVEESLVDVSGCEELQFDTKGEEPNSTEPEKPRKPSFLEKWTIKTPKKPGSDNNDTAKRKDEPTVKRIVPKRITPIPVKDTADKKKPETACSEKPELVLKSPLLNFFKSPPQKKSTPVGKKSKELSSNEPVEIILDEIEARDAWKCNDKKDESTNKSQLVEVLDDNSEDFSLHLEDTNTSTELSKEEAKIETNENKELAISQTKTVPKRRIPLITLSSPKHKKK